MAEPMTLEETVARCRAQHGNFDLLDACAHWLTTLKAENERLAHLVGYSCEIREASEGGAIAALQKAGTERDRLAEQVRKLRYALETLEQAPQLNPWVRSDIRTLLKATDDGK